MKKINHKNKKIEICYEYSLISSLTEAIRICDNVYANDIIEAYKKVIDILNNINEIESSDEDGKFKLESITRK